MNIYFGVGLYWHKGCKGAHVSLGDTDYFFSCYFFGEKGQLSEVLVGTSPIEEGETATQRVLWERR